jgi:CIC family chloride channel protein
LSKNIFTHNGFLKNICAVIFLLLVTIFTTLLIFFYCEIFYEFGNIAKEQIKNNKIFSFIFLPFLLWFSALICRIFAKNASGSNLDHITEAIMILKKSPDNYQKISHLLSFRIMIVAIISSLIATISCGSLGREGVSIYIATSIFVSSAFYLRKILPKINLESWIYAGYATGFAVAFNAPISGLIYVVEKLIKNKSKSYILTFLICFAVTLLVAFLISDNKAVYIIDKINFNYSSKEFISLAILAISCAIVIFIFRKLLIFSFDKINKFKGIKWHFWVWFFSFLIIAIANYAGIYVIGGGIKTVNDAFLQQEIFLQPLDFFSRFITTIFTFMIGASGGTVAPSIALGAGFASSLAFLSDINLHAFMLVGMMCFLSPLLANPITAGIVIVEATNQDWQCLVILIPLSLISFFTYFFINKITKSLLITKTSK